MSRRFESAAPPPPHPLAQIVYAAVALVSCAFFAKLFAVCVSTVIAQNETGYRILAVVGGVWSLWGLGVVAYAVVTHHRSSRCAALRERAATLHRAMHERREREERTKHAASRRNLQFTETREGDQ